MIPKLSKEQFRQVYDKGFEATFALFDTLQQAIETLEQRVASLEAILAKDCHNSRKLPSTDGFKRPPQSLRGKSDKKPGGQKGHEGVTLREGRAKIVAHEPRLAATIRVLQWLYFSDLDALVGGKERSPIKSSKGRLYPV